MLDRAPVWKIGPCPGHCGGTPGSSGGTDRCGSRRGLRCKSVSCPGGLATGCYDRGDLGIDSRDKCNGEAQHGRRAIDRDHGLRCRESFFAATDASLNNMVVAMAGIHQSSEKISRIIKVIDQISFQTNILALNAAVEAAREKPSWASRSSQRRFGTSPNNAQRRHRIPLSF
jgi:hypothetical protein